ncbi:MAG: hypothetical protein HQ503_05960 [Rhodospirillales bacterium]|nr:hypothetical protein [Rhodospirillales bacterium]
MTAFLRLPIAATLAAGLALTGCASGFGLSQSVDLPASASAEGDDGKPAQPSFSQFQDIPIPAGAKMNTDRSLILGARDAWIGRLVIITGFNVASAFDFFKQRASEYGWQEVTSVRSSISVLTYTRSERVLTIQIQSRRIGGSEIDMTVSPRGRSGPPPVQSDPLRPN